MRPLDVLKADPIADQAQEQAGPDLIFHTTDGYITAGVVSDAEWAGMCRAFGREELIEDPCFKTAAALGHNRTERRTIMNQEIAKWPTAEILARLDREVVPAAPVLRRGEVIADAQVVENGIIEVREDPDLGPVRQPRPAARSTETPAEIRSIAPWLGADNATILEELGYDEADIARLAEDHLAAAVGGPRAHLGVAAEVGPAIRTLAEDDAVERLLARRDEGAAHGLVEEACWVLRQDPDQRAPTAGSPECREQRAEQTPTVTRTLVIRQDIERVDLPVIGQVRRARTAGIGKADDAGVRPFGHARDRFRLCVTQDPAPALDVARAGQAEKRPIGNQTGVGVTPRLDLDVGNRGGVR